MKIPFFEGYSSDISILKKESLFISLIYLKTLKKYFTRKTAFISLASSHSFFFFSKLPLPLRGYISISRYIKERRNRILDFQFPLDSVA